MNLEEFEKELENKEYERIYEVIANRSIKLAEKIAKMKNITITYFNSNNLDDKLYTIYFRFKEQSVSFRSVIYYMSSLLEWNVEDEYLEKTREEKIKEYINSYNFIEESISRYIELENKIKKYGYEKLEKEKKEKLIILFREMLDYKHKEYSDSFSFEDYINKVSLYYNLFSDELHNVLSAINSNYVVFDIEEDYIDVNDVEKIMLLDSLYSSLTYEGDGYKENANFYRDFDLEEGQTLEDLYKLEKEKFVKLFKEMLDYIKVEYNKDNNYFEYLKDKVIQNYPFYEDRLLFMESADPNTTLVAILDSMETVYESLVKDYKNYEKNIKEYNISKKENDSEDWSF